MSLRMNLSQGTTMHASIYITQALKESELLSAGLTEKMLENCDWFNGEAHIRALGYLIKEKKLRVGSALKEIAGCTAEQAEAISVGVSRADAVRLNVYELKAYMKLRHYKNAYKSILAHRVLQTQALSDLFVSLVINHFYSPEDALVAVTGLTDPQAIVFEQLSGSGNVEQTLVTIKKFSADWEFTAIQQGAAPDEIEALQNAHQLRVLREFRQFGVSVTSLQNNSWFNSTYHYLAFKKMFTQVQKAIDREARLNTQKFETQYRHDISQLADEDNDTAQACKQRLLDEKKQINALVKEKYQSAVDNVFAELAGAHAYHAELMFKRGYSRRQVIDLSEIQARAVLDIRYPRLSPIDMVGQDWLDSDTKLDVFAYLVCDARIALDDSHSQLRQLMASLASFGEDEFTQILSNPETDVYATHKPEVTALLEVSKVERGESSQNKCVLQ